MRVLIIKRVCALENIMKEEDFYYYDKILSNEKDEEAISYFENKYSKYNYFKIIDIPSNSTDCQIIYTGDEDEFATVIAVIDGKINILYKG